MPIPVSLLVRTLGLRPKAVLHVGAHRAEELDPYRSHGWSPRVRVEALPDLATALRERFRDSDEDSVVEGAAWSTAGVTMRLNRA